MNKKHPLKETAAILQQRYGHDADVVARAPGRVNIIGEHTDYNDGFVFPCAIDCWTEVSVAFRQDKVVRVWAEDFNREDSFILDDNRPPQCHDWADYVRGMVWLLVDRFGVPQHGFDMVISGNVPTGAGLSSSASLEIAVGRALCALYQWSIDGAELALLAQQAENKFVGCQCGIMDQFISALGERGKALLLDCRSLSFDRVNIPESLAVVVIDSKIKRGLVGSEYNTRREQCERAARVMGVKALRDADMGLLERYKSELDKVDFKRARHVISEDARVLDIKEALNAGDIATISQLMAQSHASMRDDFEITVAGIDALVKMVSEVLGENGGVRMTGGGFGGCVVALAPYHLVSAIRAVVEERYPAYNNGQPAEVHVFDVVDGGHVLA